MHQHGDMHQHVPGQWTDMHQHVPGQWTDMRQHVPGQWTDMHQHASYRRAAIRRKKNSSQLNYVTLMMEMVMMVELINGQ